MTRSTHQDQIRYCERCGISFLWSAEEQRLGAAIQQSQPIVPDMCAGCLHLLPGDERQRGLVKWYNGRKRYGFIVRSGLCDIFVHGSDVEHRAFLRPGALVEFTVSETERGAAAKQVRVLGTFSEGTTKS